MKKIVLIFLSLFQITFLFSLEFSEKENELLTKVMNFRTTTKNFDNKEEGIFAVTEFHNAIKNPEVQASLNEELKLTIDNMLTAELCGFYIEKDMTKEKIEELRPVVMTLYEKNLEWKKNHSFESLNPYYIISVFDITNDAMAYLPKNQLSKVMKQSKQEYEMLAEQHPEFSLGLMNIGMFYYFMPGIIGGNKAKGRQYLADAVVYAVNDYEVFNTCIMFSQILYEEKKIEDAEKCFSRAEKLVPDSKYVKLIKDVNNAGYSFFDYAMHKEKIDKILER